MIRYTCDMCGKDLGEACFNLAVDRINNNFAPRITPFRNIQLCEKCTDNLLFRIFNYKESKNEQD